VVENQLKYFRRAYNLNQIHEKDLRDKRAHFRGNLNSFSLISLAEKTPHLGMSPLKSKEAGEKALCDLEKYLNNRIPARNTPEKELQAGILRQAQQSDWILPFGDKIRFLTSELAWPGEKTVNDILGLNKKNDLIVIELKSERLKTELIMQVNNFYEIINDKANKEFFQALTRLLAGVEWSGYVSKMIVWPFNSTSPLDWGDENITEICYLQNKDTKSIDCDKEGNIQFKDFK
jgi:hypothetical protein